MDNSFMVASIESAFFGVSQVLRWLPIPPLRRFLESKDRLHQYGVDAFDRYVAQYGRDSGRKDLLTKILVPKSLDEALTDFDVHTEIGNLVFAGTGRVK
ncbi:hypothetical protein H2204_005791 [Knufia peltigerae]|uniref:Cytochrome P450 n=1 Tax=Knufia peltigerae TaxID=1002370 RepID=A0AA38Y4Z2_9EURO|nr:hypothetical protein H2204_005791 [Knufia peltigerae]